MRPRNFHKVRFFSSSLTSSWLFIVDFMPALYTDAVRKQGFQYCILSFFVYNSGMKLVEDTETMQSILAKKDDWLFYEKRNCKCNSVCWRIDTVYKSGISEAPTGFISRGASITVYKLFGTPTYTIGVLADTWICAAY